MLEIRCGWVGVVSVLQAEVQFLLLFIVKSGVCLLKTIELGDYPVPIRNVAAFKSTVMAS